MLRGQESKQECQMDQDGPYCFLDKKNGNKWITQIANKHDNSLEGSEEIITNVLGEKNDLQYYNQRKDEYEEAFRELKKEQDIGSILITYGLNFDDLHDHFKMERFQQISIPLHQVTLFSRSDVKGKIKGSLLARTNLPSIFSHPS